MPSIVGKRRGKQTYYYLVESARVDGKPRIVSQEYLGTAEEVMARLQGSGAGEPDRSQHKAFGDVAAVWGMLKRLQVADVIDDVGDLQALQHPPHRRDVPERLVLAAVRLPRTAALQTGHDLLGGTQVLLGHDARLAVHPGGLHQVVVGLLAASLPHNGWHIWVLHFSVLEGKHPQPGNMQVNPAKQHLAARQLSEPVRP